MQSGSEIIFSKSAFQTYSSCHQTRAQHPVEHMSSAASMRVMDAASHLVHDNTRIHRSIAVQPAHRAEARTDRGNVPVGGGR